MNILIIIPRYSIDNKPSYDYAFPIGLGYISAVLKRRNYSVDCLNLNHMNGKTEDLIKDKLDSKRFDFVCTGGNALCYAFLEKIIETARKHPSHPKTILGGPIITTEPELILAMLKPNYGVLGEGEETITELIDSLQQNKDILEVKGIIFKDKHGKIIQTKKRDPIKDLDSLPFPDFEGFGFEEQLNNLSTNWGYFTYVSDHPRVYPLLGSRSCPFQCTFCYHDTNYRKRSLDNVMSELNIMVKRYKINIILIYDDCFAVNKQQLLEFCKRVNKLRQEISWDLKWTCQLMVNTVDDDILKSMRDAGCFAISYGFESYSPVVLKSMKKHITPEQIDSAFKLTVKHKILVQANFIFGDVAETNETARTTLDYYKENCFGQISLAFIQPYPGSEIYLHCLKKGLIKDKGDFIKNKVMLTSYLNMTDKMNEKDFNNLKKEIFYLTSKYYKPVIPISIKKNRPHKYTMKIKCPFCKQKITYENLFVDNRFIYGFDLACRQCNKRFFVMSLIRKILFRYNSLFRRIIDYYVYSKRTLKKNFYI